MKLEEKIAVVTGASRGIGREIAIAFADEGAKVAVCARDEAKLNELVAEIEQRGRRATALRVDVTKEADVQSLVDQTMDVYGRIDVLCNNAGVDHYGAVDELDSAKWDEVVAVNLRGPFLCHRAVLPHMKRQNYGRIVDVSSGAAVSCSAGSAAYNASKAALNALSRTLANEMSGYNILVNAMSPGFLKTDMNPEGTRPPTDAVPTAVHLASLPDDGPNGRFFRYLKELTVIENMRSWQHSGFSVDQSVFLPAGDQAGIERLTQYMTRCPFSLSRLVKVTDTGQIVYQSVLEPRNRHAELFPIRRGTEHKRE